MHIPTVSRQSSMEMLGRYINAHENVVLILGPPEEVASTGLVADLSGGIKDLADWAVEVGYKVLIPETDAGNILKLMFE
ncbi:hypothetical protein GGH94_006400, partial [Coemansia aciculifera]